MRGGVLASSRAVDATRGRFESPASTQAPRPLALKEEGIEVV